MDKSTTVHIIFWEVPWRRKWQPKNPRVLAWEIPWAKEELGRLQSMGL